MSGLGRSQRARRTLITLGRTLSDIPAEVPNAIESVESERCGQNDLGRILDRLRKSRDYLQYMHRIESSRSSKIGQKISIHYCRGLGVLGQGERSILTNTETDASETIGDGGDPCQLRLVDSEVGG